MPARHDEACGLSRRTGTAGHPPPRTTS